MSDYHHGLRVVEINDGTRTISIISTAILGLVCTAEDADAIAFPVNTPFLLINVLSAIGKASKKGTLAASLQVIADQVIRARSLDFRGTLNSRREVSYYDTTLGSVITQIAERKSLKPMLADGFAALPVAHIINARTLIATVLSKPMKALQG